VETSRNQVEPSRNQGQKKRQSIVNNAMPYIWHESCQQVGTKWNQARNQVRLEEASYGMTCGPQTVSYYNTK
jgi:hypothetical protein